MDIQAKTEALIKDMKTVDATLTAEVGSVVEHDNSLVVTMVGYVSKKHQDQITTKLSADLGRPVFVVMVSKDT